MVFFFLTALLVAAIAAAVFVPKSPGRPRLFRVIPVLVVAALWTTVTAVRSFHPIESGKVGVVYRFGEIIGQRSEGIAVIMPWEEIRLADTKVQRTTFENITAASAETQDVFLTMTLNYSLSANAVQNLFRTVGPNWFDVIVPSRLLNFAKAETAKYSTVDIIPQRETIRRNILERLAADLEPFSITVNDLLVDNIDFQPAFKDAIEEKQVASEQAKREEEIVKQREAQARQLRAQAEGERDAEIIRAEGIAEANRRIAESLSAEVLQYQAIEKLADDVTIALIPSGEGVIIDPSTLLQPPATTPPATTPPATGTP